MVVILGASSPDLYSHFYQPHVPVPLCIRRAVIAFGDSILFSVVVV